MTNNMYANFSTALLSAVRVGAHDLDSHCCCIAVEGLADISQDWSLATELTPLRGIVGLRIANEPQYVVVPGDEECDTAVLAGYISTKGPLVLPSTRDHLAFQTRARVDCDLLIQGLRASGVRKVVVSGYAYKKGNPRDVLARAPYCRADERRQMSET